MASSTVAVGSRATTSGFMMPPAVSSGKRSRCRRTRSSSSPMCCSTCSESATSSSPMRSAASSAGIVSAIRARRSWSRSSTSSARIDTVVSSSTVPAASWSSAARMRCRSSTPSRSSQSAMSSGRTRRRKIRSESSSPSRSSACTSSTSARSLSSSVIHPPAGQCTSGEGRGQGIGVRGWDLGSRIWDLGSGPRPQSLPYRRPSPYLPVDGPGRRDIGGVDGTAYGSDRCPAGPRVFGRGHPMGRLQRSTSRVYHEICRGVPPITTDSSTRRRRSPYPFFPVSSRRSWARPSTWRCRPSPRVRPRPGCAQLGRHRVPAGWACSCCPLAGWRTSMDESALRNLACCRTRSRRPSPPPRPPVSSSSCAGPCRAWREPWCSAPAWAILSSVYGPGEGETSGLNVAAVYIGLSVGPPSAGSTQSLGWHVIFCLMVPVSLAVAAIAWKGLQGEFAGAKGESFDAPGMVSYAAALLLLLLGFSRFPHGGRRGPGAAGCSASALFSSRVAHTGAAAGPAATPKQPGCSCPRTLPPGDDSATTAVGFLLSLYLQYITVRARATRA